MNQKLFLTLSPLYKSIFLLVLLFFSVFGVKIAFSQDYYFDNYTAADGLGASKVYCITQAQNDYIWIGTYGGLSQFDGKTFTNYTTEEGLAPGGVKSIINSGNGTIWTGHLNGGVSRYVEGKFEKIDTTNLNTSKDITSIIEDKLGQIWLTTIGDGVFVIRNPEEIDITQLEIENYKGGKLGDRVFGSTLLSDSSLYFLTDLGIRSFNYQTNSFEIHLPDALRNFTATKYAMLEDRHKNLWYGSRNDGLVKFDINKKDITLFDIEDGLETNFIWTLFEDSQGNIWMSNIDDTYFIKGGMTRISEDGVESFNKSNGMPDNRVHCITEDKEGNILIGTLQHGLFIFKGEQFKNITGKNIGNNTENSSSQVFSIFQTKTNTFWMGSDNGITIYNPQETSKTKFTHLRFNNSGIHNKVRFIKEDKHNNIYVGTSGGGMFGYNKSKKQFDPIYSINQVIYGEKIITSLEIDDNGNLWVGSSEGLIYYEVKTQRAVVLTQLNGIPGNIITSLFIDDKQNVWVGSQGRGVGLIKPNEDSGTIINELQDYSPKCFTQDLEGNIWIGTEGQGLFVYNGDSITKQLSVKDGILSNLIKFLVCDKTGNIYIGTNKGLNKYLPTEDKIYTYTKKNGYIGIESNDHAALCSNNDELWFGTTNGVSIYNPKASFTGYMEPLTHISSFSVNGVERDLIDNTKLSYKENKIIFDFNCISLTNPDAVEYQYRLNGLDTEWQKAGSQTRVNYQALRAGKYTFMVKAKNTWGIWNKKPIQFNFSISPPFYRTWWFLITAFLTLTISIIIFIKVRERNLKKDKKILEEKVTIRTAELSEAKNNLEIVNGELASKNKDITDSIQYAQRIQFAILPEEMPFPDNFVLFKPKDIVSGDFYWALNSNSSEYVAAVDCTGHGVPGAFMSFIGYSSLNSIITDKNITKPSEILMELNRDVSSAMDHHHGEDEVYDGMDLALIKYEPKKKVLEYSGAYNSLIIIRNGEVIEVKADRCSIGKSTPLDKQFTNHEIEMEKGDMIYIFSDGYADQFGGADNKKFKSKPLKNLFAEIAPLDVKKQYEILDTTFEEWRGENEQLDDILIIGRRF